LMAAPLGLLYFYMADSLHFSNNPFGYIPPSTISSMATYNDYCYFRSIIYNLALAINESNNYSLMVTFINLSSKHSDLTDINLFLRQRIDAPESSTYTNDVSKQFRFQPAPHHLTSPLFLSLSHDDALTPHSPGSPGMSYHLPLLASLSFNNP
jgi:hypothetical protein